MPNQTITPFWAPITVPIRSVAFDTTPRLTRNPSNPLPRPLSPTPIQQPKRNKRTQEAPSTAAFLLPDILPQQIGVLLGRLQRLPPAHLRPSIIPQQINRLRPPRSWRRRGRRLLLPRHHRNSDRNWSCDRNCWFPSRQLRFPLQRLRYPCQPHERYSPGRRHSVLRSHIGGGGVAGVGPSRQLWWRCGCFRRPHAAGSCGQRGQAVGEVRPRAVQAGCRAAWDIGEGCLRAAMQCAFGGEAARGGHRRGEVCGLSGDWRGRLLFC